MLVRRSSLALAILFVSSLAEAGTITAAQVESAVKNRFPLIEKAQFNVEAARQKRLAAEGEFDTKIKVKSANRFDNKYDYRDLETYAEKQLPFQGLSLYAGHHLGLGSIPAYTGKYETAPNGEVFAGARLPLLRNRSIDEARFQLVDADFRREIATVEQIQQTNFYMMKALSTYQKWKLAQRKLDARTALLDIATARQKMMEKQVRLGDVERIALVDAKRSLLKRQADVTDSQNELANVKAEMALYLRNEDGTSRDLTNEVPDLSIEPFPTSSSFKLKIEDLPQIAILRKSRELQDRAVDYGRNQRLPELNLAATTYHELPSSQPVDTTRLQVGIYFELPLENRKGRGLEGEARAKREAFERQRIYAESELQARLQQSITTMEASRNRIALLEEELKSAQIVADAERRRWRSGDSNLFMVAAREEEAASVEIRRWTAEYDFRAAEVEARFTTASFAPAE